MKKIFVSGATGNVGQATIKHLLALESGHQIIAGVRSIAKAKNLLPKLSRLEYRQFDLTKAETCRKALTGIDILFLLRPPNISKVSRYFDPLIKIMRQQAIEEVVFLSVQGADKNKIIPHNKIEKILKNSNLNYVFLRPSYFMQNLTTTLADEIRQNNRIFLPSGNMQVNWIDVEDIGQAAAIILTDFSAHQNKIYELTSHENLDFMAVSNILAKVLERPIEFQSPNLWQFYYNMRRKKMPFSMILVMILLHYGKLHKRAPNTTNDLQTIIKKEATSLYDFIVREKEQLMPL